VDGENVQLRDVPAIGIPRVPAQGNRPYFSADGSRLYYYSSNTVSSKLIAGGGEQTHMSLANYI